MSHWLKSKLFLILVVLVLAYVGVTWIKGRSPTSDTVLETVGFGDLIQKVTIAGSVSPDHKSLISAPYSSYVKKIFVEIGQHVKINDPIVSLTQSMTGAHEDIYPIRAPIAGTVVQVLKAEGEYVDQQNTNGNGIGIVRIDDLEHLHVDATSPEFQVEKLKVGQKVLIKATSVPGRTYNGRIRNIALAAKEQKDWDKSRVEFTVTIDVLDADSQLKSGISVICDIETGKATHVLTLKHEYLRKDGEKYSVVTEAGVKKEITVGLQNEEAFEIKSGLSEGEKIRQTDFLAIGSH
jgi:multidrug efflux pump subunit AcrA (membrane-fusion protein)